MLGLIAPQSLGEGVLIIAVLSFFLALGWAFVPSRALRWLGTILTPAVLAICLYRYPVWAGANPSEYSAWFLVCFVPWFVIGAAVSAVVLFMLRRY